MCEQEIPKLKREINEAIVRHKNENSGMGFLMFRDESLAKIFEYSGGAV